MRYGETVECGEEGLEGREERPVGEQTNALVHVQRLLQDNTSAIYVHSTETYILARVACWGHLAILLTSSPHRVRSTLSSSPSRKRAHQQTRKRPQQLHTSAARIVHTVVPQVPFSNGQDCLVQGCPFTRVGLGPLLGLGTHQE